MFTLTESIILFCCFNLTILEFGRSSKLRFHKSNLFLKDIVTTSMSATRTSTLMVWSRRFSVCLAAQCIKFICGFLCFCRRAVCVEHYVTACVQLCLLKTALLCMSLCVCVCWICFYCQMKLKYPLQKMQTWKNGPLCPSFSTPKLLPSSVTLAMSVFLPVRIQWLYERLFTCLMHWLLWPPSWSLCQSVCGLGRVNRLGEPLMVR